MRPRLVNTKQTAVVSPCAPHLLHLLHLHPHVWLVAMIYYYTSCKYGLVWFPAPLPGAYLLD